MTQSEKQKQMPAIAFNAMKLVMSARKLFRNIDDEIGFAGLKQGDIVLDFGCGLGFNSIPAAKIVGLNGKVFALDVSRQAIEIVEKKAQKNNLNNIETILSGCKTGLHENSVDIVYLHNTLPLVESKEKVLNEIYSILKVKGKLSYMSRSFSRIAGNNSMDDRQLQEYLEKENRFKLIKSKKKHLIFEKIK